MINRIIQRGTVSLLLVVALALSVFSSCVRLDGFSGKALRQARIDMEEVLTTFENDILTNREQYRDDLKDCDLPYTGTKLKKEFSFLRDTVDLAVNNDYSIGQLDFLFFKLPHTLSLLESFAQFSQLHADDPGRMGRFYAWAEESCDALLENKTIFLLLWITLTVFLGLLLLSGVLAVVFTVLRNAHTWRWLFFVLVLMLLAALVTLQILSGELLYQLDMPFDIDLTVTATPFLSAIISLAACIVPLIFNNKKERIDNVRKQSES